MKAIHDNRDCWWSRSSNRPRSPLSGSRPAVVEPRGRVGRGGTPPRDVPRPRAPPPAPAREGGCKPPLKRTFFSRLVCSPPGQSPGAPADLSRSTLRPAGMTVWIWAGRRGARRVLRFGDDGGDGDPLLRPRPGGSGGDRARDARRTVGVTVHRLQDLNPAASFLAYTYNTVVDPETFEQDTRDLIESVAESCSFALRIGPPQGGNAGVPAGQARTGTINYTVWSAVMICLVCAAEVVIA